MSIKPLPADVVAQIKSSVVITSLNNVICGLIKNSLDAEATRINLTLDYSRGNCSVEDNGTGIPPSEFRHDGGLGQLHYTSKHPPRPSIHGRHGVFLASVASLSLLSVTSHHRAYHSHNSMSIHNSKVLARHLPCPPEQRILTFNHGTRVAVRDLFGSMPVRVKHRALQGDRGSASRDWDRLLYELVALMIFWSGEVSLSIREISGRQKLTLRTGAQPRSLLSVGCRLLHQASFCDSPDTGDWVPIGASAPRMSIDGYVCRVPVATKRAQFISLGIEPLSNDSSCNVLFEEVNKVFADSAFGAVDYESDSEPSRKRPKMDGFTGKEMRVRKGVDRWPMFFLKVVATPSFTKGPVNVEDVLEDVLDDRAPTLALIIDLLKATFYEFLKKNYCRPKTVDFALKDRSGHNHHNERSRGKSDPAKTRLSTVSSFVSRTIGEPARKIRRFEPSSSRPGSPFDGWSRVKSGPTLSTFKEPMQASSRPQSRSLTPTIDRQDAQDVARSKQSAPPVAKPSQTPLYDNSGNLTRQPFEHIGPERLRGRSLGQRASQRAANETSATPQQDVTRDGSVEWVNPATKLVTLFDPRTGFVLPSKPLTLSKRTTKQATEMDNPNRTSPRGVDSTVPWVKDLVARWKNPVFELTERPIPKLPDIGEVMGMVVKPGGYYGGGRPSSVSTGSYHEIPAMALRGKLSKDALRRSELVAQVDNKFILVKMPFGQAQPSRMDAQKSSAPSCLVLIDQHAADERCRVEDLMKDYFVLRTTETHSNNWEAVTEVLPKPLFFELTRQDRDVLSRYSAYFARWGICYDVETAVLPVGQSGSKRPKHKAIHANARVAVRSLPPAILERCRTEPRLLSDLIRTEAWRLNDESGPGQQRGPAALRPQETGDNSPSWVSLFHGCPQGIIELINSRSCRSAIMFNDPLSRDQCAELLGRLVECAFPFQCAHGRPSMVPLIDLGGGMARLGNASEERKTGFGRGFKQWRERKQ